MQLKRNFSALCVGVVLGASSALTGGVFATQSQQNAELPLEELRTFTEVYTRIKRDYVDAVDDRKLIDAAVRGMLSSLDPHSTYMDSDEYRKMRAGTRGEFGGLGIEVSMEGDLIKVISPIDGSPAHQAGIQAGDLIERLGEKAVKGMALGDAIKLMRGKVGTEITLSIIRQGVDEPLQITLKRDLIQVSSVRAKMLEPGFGYIRISQFQSRTGDDVAEALARLKKQAGGNLQGLVLDVRNNPGGVLRTAVEVSDLFLEQGRIVSTRGRKSNEVTFDARSGDELNGAPIVLLVNGGSASASEILAGALQDHGRAVIMGEQSYGKGSVQSIMPLQAGDAMKMTTARYYTPAGRSIHSVGIAPDIALETLKAARSEDQTPELKQANLSAAVKLGSTRTAETAELAASDFGLAEALNLLKGMNILSQRSN